MYVPAQNLLLTGFTEELRWTGVGTCAESPDAMRLDLEAKQQLASTCLMFPVRDFQKGRGKQSRTIWWKVQVPAAPLAYP